MVLGILRRSMHIGLLILTGVAGCDGSAGEAPTQTGVSYAQPSKPSPEAATSVQVVVNRSPRVVSIDSSTGLLTSGGSVQVTARVTDPDGDAVTVRWRSSCPGDFDRDDTLSATFVAGLLPAEVEACGFEILVDDGHGGQTAGLLTLSTVAPTIVVAPIISTTSQSADDAAAGQGVFLEAIAPGGPWMWSWNASAGLLSAQTDTGDASAVLWEAPPEAGTCTITVTAAQRDGARTPHAFTVHVSP